MKIDILGTTYDVFLSNSVEYPELKQVSGFCDETVKLCVIDSMSRNNVLDKLNLNECRNKVIRHELIHAFLFECGLSENSWASNEEIVDWIAAIWRTNIDNVDYIKI